MTIAVTRAAIELERRSNSISPYEVIALLLDGALERLEQAQTALSKGDTKRTGILIEKAIGILNGLRENLNFEAGGELASNLDSLYEYMIRRLCEAEEDTGMEIMSETRRLLSEIKMGWDGIAIAAA